MGREQTRQADLKSEESEEKKKCLEERGRLQHPLVQARSLALNRHCLAFDDPPAPSEANHAIGAHA
jgi:hypothetical protein